MKYDRFDIAALNGWMELAWYYVPVLEAENKGTAVESKAPPSCSAFIATGSYTADGRIVIAHNIWMDYLTGERWNVILDIVPDTGRRMLMDALPGFVHSGSDFAFNDAGLLFTETTIAKYAGFNKDGVPSFSRSRTAAQYAASIDDFIRIMTTNGNGAMANSWLIGDLNANEIARLELGLKNHRVWRTGDGYFVGSNFPSDEKLIAEETTFDPGDGSQSVFVRRDRWEQLMAENKGKIDIEKAMAFLGDHIDPRTGETAAGADATLRACRPGSQRRAGILLSALLPGRLDSGQGHFGRLGRTDEILGPDGPRLRRGFCGRAVCRRPSRIRLAASLLERHESPSLDPLPGEMNSE